MLLALIIILHAIKFFRIYFILLEEVLSPVLALKVYIKTAFVNLLIPFKLGEIYRMYAYGYKIKSYSKGVIAIIVERYFDALVLFTLLLILSLSGGINSGEIIVLALLAVFVIFSSLIFSFFGSTYKYLNRFFIVRGGGKKSLRALQVLEKSYSVYNEAAEMVRGRQLLCVVLSVLAWLVESIFVILVGHFTGITTTISNYISDGYLGIGNNTLNCYILLCSVFFVATISLVYPIQLLQHYFNARRKS